MSRSINDTEGPDIPVEDTGLRPYKGKPLLSRSGQVYMPESTALVPFSFITTFSDTFQSALHVGDTP